MGGVFDASVRFDHDPVATAQEIETRGAAALQWLADLASKERPDIDIHLVRNVHRRWFETTFPDDAGRERSVMVLNRKQTAYEVEEIVPGVLNACADWTYRFEAVVQPASGEDQIELLIAEANTLAVRIYDIHPFRDGNTRTTFHVRNYALMLGGLQPLEGLHDVEEHQRAWMKATPLDHDSLDEIVLETLMEQTEDS